MMDQHGWCITATRQAFGEVGDQGNALVEPRGTGDEQSGGPGEGCGERTGAKDGVGDFDDIMPASATEEVGSLPGRGNCADITPRAACREQGHPLQQARLAPMKQQGHVSKGAIPPRPALECQGMHGLCREHKAGCGGVPRACTEHRILTCSVRTAEDCTALNSGMREERNILDALPSQCDDTIKAVLRA